MLKPLPLILMLHLGCMSVVYAQDPAVGGIVATPASLATGAAGSITANILNNSSVAIPQANKATFIINLPPNIGVVGSGTFSAPASATNITTTIGVYDATNGTIVTLVSDKGPFPGNVNINFTLNIIGVKPTTVPTGITINASTNPAIGTNNSQNDNASTFITVTGPLPVNLVSFTAKAQDNGTVAVAWSTARETDNKSFLIERSKDLVRFEKVGEISELSATSNSLKQYSLIDPTPYAGTSYYRLMQTDLSGKTTLFPAVSVVLREGAYGVFPNPVATDQRFSLVLDEPETAILRFVSLDGRTLPLQKAGIQAGNLLLKPADKLTTGVYILTVQERGQTRQHRLLIE